MKRSVGFVLLLVLFALLPTLVLAQEGDAPPATIVAENIPTPSDALAALLVFLGTFAVAVGPVAEPITALYKYVVARWWPQGLSYLPFVAVGVPVVLTLIYWATDALGYGSQYVVVLNNLVSFVPVLLSLFAALFGQAVSYQLAKRADVPILGQSTRELTNRIVWADLGTA